jgi:hypothetical protein
MIVHFRASEPKAPSTSSETYVSISSTAMFFPTDSIITRHPRRRPHILALLPPESGRQKPHWHTVLVHSPQVWARHTLQDDYSSVEHYSPPLQN